MKFNKYILILTVGCLSVTGCSKQVLNSEIVEAPIAPKVEEVVRVDKFSYNDDFEKLDQNSYNHYIMALLLESENPPDIQAAAEHYKIALQRYPYSTEILYSLANSYMSMRLFAESIELLARINPPDKKVLKLQGFAYLQVDKQDSAKYVFEKLAQIDPNEATSYFYLSKFYAQRNNSDSLMWAYENLTRLLSFNHKYWQELGKLKAQKGDFQAAKKAFEKSLEKNNTAVNLLSYVGLAEMYKIEQKFDSVLIVYKNALLVDSTNGALYEDISMLYAQLDSLEQSIPYAENAVKFKPQDMLALRRLGIIYFGTQKFDLAESVFTELVNRGEKNFLNHFYLGRIAVQNKDFNIAVDEFKIMVQLNDSIPEHWMDLGYAYKKLNDYPHELLAYRTGLEKTTNEKSRVKLLFSLGTAYEQAKMVDSAIVTFEKILLIDKNNHQAMNYLGYMLVEQEKEFSYAEKLIKKALKLSPDNAAYLDSYGWLFYKKEKFKKALKYLEKAATYQKDSVIYEHVGDAYSAKGDTVKAIKWWNKALELNPKNEVLQNKLK